MLRRGQYLALAGGLAAHLDADLAGDLLEQALECTFGGGRQPPVALRAECFAAFDELVAFLSGREEWKRLERVYRTMIRRLAPGSAELPRLWSELGLEPLYPSIATGIPAALDECVAFRWIHPVEDPTGW